MYIQVCRDTSDAVALYLPQRLYLKPYAKLNISVQLPSSKVHGKAISNWDLMEKLRKMIQPDSFASLKVSKHSSEVIRFDAELECRSKLERALARLEDRVVQLNDYPDQLKVRVSEAKTTFPSRHAWDSFFRDAVDMDEMKPGERPDTVHIVRLPIRWFVHHSDRDEDAPPSASVFKKAFEKFGNIRQVDVPASDPFRMQMKSSMRGISLPPSESALFFEGYVQFSEYVGFVRCMDALRGMKIMRKKDDIAEWCDINVDFDKSKHMTDAAVKRRSIVRERLIARQRAKEDEEKQEKDKIAKHEAKERQRQSLAEQDQLERMRAREERRKRRQLARLVARGVDVPAALAGERRRLLRAQRRLQALRLVEELFRRIEIRGMRDQRAHGGGGGGSGGGAGAGEAAARARLVDKMKRQQEAAVDEQRARLRDAADGRIVIRSALEAAAPRRRSLSSPSSAEEVKRIKTERLTTPERETEFKKALGLYGVPYGFPYAFPPCPPAYPYAQSHHSLFGYAGAPAYYPPPAEYAPRRPWRARGRGRGRGRPYGDHDRYRFEHNEHDDRRSRSRSRSRRRSRSRSRRRHRSRSRSRSRRRSHSRRSRSRSSRSRHTRSRSRSGSRRRSRSRSKPRSQPRSPAAAPAAPAAPASPHSGQFKSPNTVRRRSRSKSWSLPKDTDNGKAWSKSPKDK